MVRRKGKVIALPVVSIYESEGESSSKQYKPAAAADLVAKIEKAESGREGRGGKHRQKLANNEDRRKQMRRSSKV